MNLTHRRESPLKSERPAYLDNSATTPVCAAAANKALAMMTDCYGNPSSLHTAGIRAEQEMSLARSRIAALLGVRPQTIVFTSGGTEANNLAILGGAGALQRRGRHAVTTAIEHPSVLAAFDELERLGFETTRVAAEEGGLSARRIAEACRPDTVLVSIMLVNNETGARLPVREAVPLIRKRSSLARIHCDAVQAAGRMSVSALALGVDLLSISGHKLHAPKGCGALYVREGVRLLPRAFGGGQERGLRAGTEATPLIAAFGAAVEALPAFAEQEAHFRHLQERLLAGVNTMEGVIWLSPAGAVPYIVNLSLPGLQSETMLHFLAERGVYVSSGSACSKGAASPVLKELGVPPAVANAALRVSFSRDNTDDDVDRLVQGLREAQRTLARR